ncbi:hypothetical protein TNCV_132531 [Trichonephila clavipes]|nr:hypothetical protein TNCV_132531 [Trichonephila clavipes]
MKIGGESLSSQYRDDPEEILKLMNRSDSALGDLLDDDYAEGKAYERRILGEESSSDQNDGKNKEIFVI